MDSRQEGKEDQPEARARTFGTAEARLKDLSVAELLVRLEPSSEGLSQAEAEHRLDQYDYDELTEKKVNSILKSLSDSRGPTPGMIIVSRVSLVSHV